MTDAPTYLVIGASGAIGTATARRLAARGARLALAGRREAPLQALADALAARALPLDATDPEAVERACAEVAAWGGRLDGVVNLAGSILLKPAHLTRPDELAQVLQQNLVSAFNVVRSGAKHMPAGGSIVLMASAAARTGLPNHEAIAAAKGGVIALALSAAATYASRGVRVNAVAPGLVRSEMSARITATPQGEQASTALHALGRLGTADDVAPILDWLLGAESGWVTGQVIGVDGGLGTVRGR